MIPDLVPDPIVQAAYDHTILGEPRFDLDEGQIREILAPLLARFAEHVATHVATTPAVCTDHEVCDHARQQREACADTALQAGSAPLTVAASKHAFGSHLDLLAEWLDQWARNDNAPVKLPHSLHTRTAGALTAAGRRIPALERDE